MFTRIPPRIAALATATAATLGLAACGGNDTNASKDATGSTSASVIEEARSSVESASKPVTSILLSEPLKEAPPKDGMVVYLQANLATAKPTGIGIEQATQALGWGYKSIQVDIAEPSTVVGAMKQALQYNPTAVVLPSTPVQVWQGEIEEYESAGVKIVPLFQHTDQTDTVIGNVVGPEDVMRAGEVIADYVIAESDGKARGLVVYAPDVPSEAEFAEAVHERLSDCTGCGFSDFQLTTAQLGDGSGTAGVISELQKDPEIDYIINGYGPQLPGLTGALQAAGFDDRVKITGYAGGPGDFEAIRQGEMDAYTATPFIYAGYAAVDSVLRSLQGLPVAPDAGGVPLRLVTKDQDFDVDAMANYNEPTDALGQFKKLWGLG